MEHQNTNEFGKLVQRFRKQRGWTQDELAERWGFTRQYLSSIEQGKRKLDKPEHLNRLADLLHIPQEYLDAIGKSPPLRTLSAQQENKQHDLLLQALLDPAETTVKLSWLLWQNATDAVANVDIVGNLAILQHRLIAALSTYQGQFRLPALRLLTSVYEMQGKLAVDRVATQEATSYFQAMYTLGEELAEKPSQLRALMHQSEMFRRRGQHETAIRLINGIEKQKDFRTIPLYLQATFYRVVARNAFVAGNEQTFARAIDRATDIATTLSPDLNIINNEIDPIELLQTRAQGYFTLGKPEKALEIYQRTDILRPSRPLRAQGSYDIEKAQAYAYAGYIDKAAEHALTGIHIAETLQTIRPVVRLQQMADKVSLTPIGQKRDAKELRKEIHVRLQRMKEKKNE